MNYDPRVHHRRSIRLKNYDYSQPGAYFVSICVHRRACLFGEIINGKMQLNEIGQIVGGFKSAVTRRVNLQHNLSGKRLWQRNYYEHVVRDEAELQQLREYMVNNSLKWELDGLHPNNPSKW